MSGLSGKRVLVTRAEGQAHETVALLEARGAEPVVVPTIAFGPPDDPAAAERAIASLDEYAWVVFTSANGVAFTFELLQRTGIDASALGATRVAVVGPGTARALSEHGFAAHLVAKELKGEGLARAMLEVVRPGDRVLLLRAQVARDVLPDTLREHGAHVDVVAVYKTFAPEGLGERLRALLEPQTARDGLDAALFTSASTVQNVCAALGAKAPDLFGKITVASIGPVTSDAARALGLGVDVEAHPHTLPDLVDALERALRR